MSFEPQCHSLLAWANYIRESWTVPQIPFDEFAFEGWQDSIYEEFDWRSQVIGFIVQRWERMTEEERALVGVMALHRISHLPTVCNLTNEQSVRLYKALKDQQQADTEIGNNGQV